MWLFRAASSALMVFQEQVEVSGRNLDNQLNQSDEDTKYWWAKVWCLHPMPQR